MAYTKQSNVEAFLGRDLTQYEEQLLPLMIKIVDTYIIDRMGGTYETAAETTRYYDGEGSIIRIDPAIDITKVAVIDSLENDDLIYDLNVDYEVRPRNSTNKRWIELRAGKFPCGVANIAVTAKFTLGDEVPEDIEYLSTYLTGSMFKESFTGELKSESIEGYSRTFKEFVVNDSVSKMILDKYIQNDVLI